MVEENDIIEFLKVHDGKASLNDVATGLGIPKYGPNSAYALLQSLKNKGVVERRGELWTLIIEEVKPKEKAAAAPAPTPPSTAEKEAAMPDVEKLMKAMAKTIAEAMKGAQVPPDEWELATKPMTTKIERKEEKLSALVLRPDEAVEAKKPLIGFPTGTYLDYFFLTPEGKPLNGLPICGQFAITGLPGAGKSILVEEIAV
ncbi:MAG: helix-turn-helix domain-containing protein, partial [Candidatus Bathyarchaeales archaeon]